jgi:glycosyltransferase involved in cell wall biosynthesis
MSGLRLLLTTDAVGGVWAYSVELARALRPFGIDTIIAVMGPSPDAKQREEVADVPLIDTGLPLEWLDTNADEIRKAGTEIARLADCEKADIIQTSSAALLADVEVSHPCVAMQHSCVATWWAAVRGRPLPSDFAWRRELVAEGLRRAAVVVAPTLAFAAETAGIYKLLTPVNAVHNGRRCVAFPQIPQGQFVFTAGRLWDEGKNVATLDRAARRLDVPFQAAGSTQGPNEARAELEHVQPLGQLSQTRLAGIYAARPIYASAALYEPFGLSVLEAAQAGCALVLSDIPTHREIWGGAAIFVPPRNDSAFAGAIQALLDDPERRDQLGHRAHTRASHFTPERMARGMAEIYARVSMPPTRAAPAEMAGAA